MRRRIGAKAVVAGLAVWGGLIVQRADAASFGVAVASGNWNVAGTWTPSGVPGASDNAYIGSNTPSGAAATAAVTLTQNQAAANVYLGQGSGTSGTLNLGTNTLTIGNNLYYGWSGGTAAINRTTGSFTAPNLYVGNGNSLSLGGGDAVTNLSQRGGSSLTTTATGNITGIATVDASTLTLGANLGLGTYLDVRNGGTVNAQGHAINADYVYLGWFGGVGHLTNRGNFTVGNLNVANQNFDLTASDAVTNFAVRNGATNFLASQSVQGLGLSNGATATTTATGNITGIATVDASTLTLGANLGLGTYLDVRNGGTVNAQGHAINADYVYLGWFGGVGHLTNRGNFTVGNLNVANQNFDLTASDAVTNFAVRNGATNFLASQSVQGLGLSNGATATTTATGNITGIATVDASTLTLGADLGLGTYLDVRNGGTVNAQGHAINAGTVYLGYFNGPGSLTNAGDFTLGNLNVGHGSAVTLPGLNETINSNLLISGASTVTIAQADGVLTGLTLNGSNAGALSILDTSVLDLQFGLSAGTNWIFRWANPAAGGSDWIATLTSLIGNGRITVTSPVAYNIQSSGGYTYIQYTREASPVPEPATLGMTALGVGLLTLFSVRRRRRAS